jgi:hypothetical protein
MLKKDLTFDELVSNMSGTQSPQYHYERNADGTVVSSVTADDEGDFPHEMDVDMFPSFCAGAMLYEYTGCHDHDTALRLLYNTIYEEVKNGRRIFCFGSTSMDSGLFKAAQTFADTYNGCSFVSSDSVVNYNSGEEVLMGILTIKYDPLELVRGEYEVIYDNDGYEVYPEGEEDDY